MVYFFRTTNLFLPRFVIDYFLPCTRSNALRVRLLSLSFLLCGLIFSSFSQTPEADSINLLLDHEGDTPRKVELLNALSFSYFATNIELGNTTTQQALDVARKINDATGEGWALAYRGLYFQLSGRLPDATYYYKQSYSAGKNLDNHDLQTYAYTQRGNAYVDRGSFDSAYYCFQVARQLGKKASPYYQSGVLLNLGRYFQLIHQNDSALHYIQQSLTLREALGNNALLIADGWILLGNCYREMDAFDKAEELYQRANVAAPNDLIVQADYLQNMGEIYFIRGDFTRALENWSKVLALHRQYQYKYVLAELLFRMGAAFQEQGYFNLSSEYLTRALSIAEHADYQYLMGRIYNELGWLHYRSLNFDLARIKNQQAEQLLKSVGAQFELTGCWDLRGLIERNRKHYDSALYYHKKSLAARIPLNDKTEISDGYFNLGDFFEKTGKPHEALPYFFKSIALDEALENTYGLSLGYNRVGRIYTSLARFDSAKIYLEKSLALATPIASNEIFRDNYIDLGTYYEKIGQPEKAIYYYKHYNQLSDSIFSKQAAQSLAAYQILYDVERNEKKIELLNKDNAINKAQVERQRTILYSVLAGFIGLLVLAVFYYRFNSRLRKLNAALAEKNEEIQTQSEVLMKTNESLHKLNVEIAEQKEEIQAQAEELTESNQSISNINETLEQRIEERTKELKQAYKELDTFFYRASHDFRRPLTTFMGLSEVAKITVKDNAALELFERVNETARNLDKMLMKLQSISDLGVQELIYKEVSIEEIFANALAQLDSEILQRNIRTTVEVEAGLCLYSYPALIKIMVDNLIENAVSFCGVNNPAIVLKAYHEQTGVVIQIHDNGQGIEKAYIDRVFDMYFRGTERSKGNGLGLYIVKKTADKLKAHIGLTSETGEGTTVTIHFPGTKEFTS